MESGRTLSGTAHPANGAAPEDDPARPVGGAASPEPRSRSRTRDQTSDRTRTRTDPTARAQAREEVRTEPTAPVHAKEENRTEAAAEPPARERGTSRRPAPGRQRPRRARGGGPTRERLLAAASELFAERGYERATVRDIAARAGVNQALLFRHFGSKRALFGEAVSRGGLEQLRTTPPEQLLEAILTGMLAAPPDQDGDATGAARSLETLLRSVGAQDEVAAAVASLGTDYARVLATLGDTDDRELRADLALAWLLGIGLMRVVIRKQPLADADPAEVTRLVTDTVTRLLKDPDRQRTPGENPGTAPPGDEATARHRTGPPAPAPGIPLDGHRART
ncbi:TetR/AcrR family transcriptional regulator [Streptomyces thermolilacinus]|uniref:TetR/AcrR family transcriptional regulator n=1 Tax=Streptomyces thermolilacinus TaxID=285540 RepID=UPI0003C75CE5